MHRVRAKINAAGPFHTAEVGVDGDGVKGFCLQQFQEHPAASLGFDGINPFESIVEPNLQTIAGERLRCFNPNHPPILIQRRDFGRLLIVAGQFPSLTEFIPVQRGPFQHQRQRPPPRISAPASWTTLGPPRYYISASDIGSGVC